MAKERASRALARSMPGDISRQGSGTPHIESTHVVPPAMTDDQRIRASRDSRSLSFAIPTKEADLVPFVLNFARTLASDPQRFITPPEEARTLLELAEDYANLFARAQDRTTRSPGVNARKDAARTIAVKAVRTHAKWIKAQPAISVEDKMKVGFVNG